MLKDLKAKTIIDKVLEWSIYLMILLLPISKSMIEICVSVGIVLLILKKIRTRNLKLPATPANIPLLFVFLTAALSLYNSQYPALSLRALFAKNLKFIAVYFLVIEAIDNREKMMNVIKIGLISAILVFVDIFFQYFVTHRDLFHLYPAFKYMWEIVRYGKVLEMTLRRGSPTGPFPFPNDLSAWLLIVLPPAIFISIFGVKDRLHRWGMVIFSVVGLYIFVLAKARSAWLGFVVAMGSLAVLAKKAVAILLIAVFVLGVAILFAKSPALVFGFSSTQDRAVMWNNGMKIFKAHPIIGNGINTFFNLYKEVRQDEWTGKKGSYAHNCYLQMASDVGLLGLVSFLWFVITIITEAARSLKNTPDPFYHSLTVGLITGLLAFLIHSFFDTNLYSLNLAFLFWISAGFLTAVVRIAGLNK